MTPETRQPTRREDLIQRMLFRAETWERGTYGDQGLRLMAEDSAKLLRDAADLLREEGEAACTVCGRKHVNDNLRRLRSMCYDCRRSDPDDEDTPALAECTRCGELDCPHNEPLHYHHDGCPACIGDDRCDPKAARIPLDRGGASRVDPVPPPPHQDEQKG